MENPWDLETESGRAGAHKHGRRAKLGDEVGALAPHCTVLEAVDVVHREGGCGLALSFGVCCGAGLEEDSEGMENEGGEERRKQQGSSERARRVDCLPCPLCVQQTCVPLETASLLVSPRLSSTSCRSPTPFSPRVLLSVSSFCRSPLPLSRLLLSRYILLLLRFPSLSLSLSSPPPVPHRVRPFPSRSSCTVCCFLPSPNSSDLPLAHLSFRAFSSRSFLSPSPSPD